MLIMPQENNSNTKNFCIAPIMKDGKPTLIIRKTFTTKNEINNILRDILTNGFIEIKAIVKFRDPLSAKIRLKKLGLID